MDIIMPERFLSWILGDNLFSCRLCASTIPENTKVIRVDSPSIQSDIVLRQIKNNTKNFYSMKKNYFFPSDQITPEVFEDFKSTIWDPDYTHFELKGTTVYPHNRGIRGFNDPLFEILLEALTNREVPITTLSLWGLNPAQKISLLKLLRDKGCSLRTLDLSSNAIDAEEAKILADIVKAEDVQLRSLTLAKNDLRDEGARAIANALKCSDSKLEALDLSDNCIQEGGFIALASALMNSHCKIKHLDISYHPVDESAIKAIGSAIACPTCPIITLKVYYGTAKSQGFLFRSITKNPNIIYLNGRVTQHYQRVRSLADKIQQGDIPLALEDIQVFRECSRAIHWLLGLADDDTSVIDYVQSFIACQRYLDFLNSRVDTGFQSASWAILEEHKRAYQDFRGCLPRCYQKILSGLEENLLSYLKRYLRRSVSVLPVDVLCCVPEVFSDSRQSQRTLALFFSKHQSFIANILESIQVSGQSLSNLLIALTLQSSGLKEIAFEDAKRMIKQTFCVIKLLLSAKQQEDYKDALALWQDQEALACIFNRAIQYVNQGILDPAQRGFLFKLGDCGILSPINLSYRESYDPHAELCYRLSAAEQALAQEQAPKDLLGDPRMFYPARKRHFSNHIRDEASEERPKRPKMTYLAMHRSATA